MRRTLLYGALALLVVCLAAPAFGHQQVRYDGNDTGGPLGGTDA